MFHRGQGESEVDFMPKGKMGRGEMSDEEAQRIAQALLRYCELDTFAMVMLFEYWKSEVIAVRKKDVA